jgi:hypothetical protein
MYLGHAVVQFGEVRYKPKGRGFDQVIRIL